MRVLLHQLAVLERPGLGLVGVADEVLVHLPLGDEGHLLAHREPGAAAAADLGGQDLLQDLLRLHLHGLAQHLVAAALLVDLQRVEPGLVEVLEQELHEPATFRFRSCLASSTGRPSSTSSTIARQSSGSSGPTYSPSTDAIGAMSQAPRHSNERTLKRGSSPAVSSISWKIPSAPRREQEMFVHTNTV